MDYLRVYDMLKKHGAYMEPEEKIVVNAFEDQAEAAVEEFDGAAENDYFDSILESFSKHVAVDDNNVTGDNDSDSEGIVYLVAEPSTTKPSDEEYDMVGADSDEDFGDGTGKKGDGEFDEETIITVENDVIGDSSSEENVTDQINIALERSEMDSIDDSMEEINVSGGAKKPKKKKKPAPKKQTEAPAPAPIIPLTPPVVLAETAPPVEPVVEKEKDEEEKSDEPEDEEEEEAENEGVENDDNINTNEQFEEINAIVGQFKKIKV